MSPYDSLVSRVCVWTRAPIRLDDAVTHCVNLASGLQDKDMVIPENALTRE